MAGAMNATDGGTDEMIRVQASDLLKIYDALANNDRYHTARDTMNAQLHMSGTVRAAPLASQTSAERDRLKIILRENDIDLVGQMSQQIADDAVARAIRE